MFDMVCTFPRYGPLKGGNRQIDKGMETTMLVGKQAR
jgi:hypothetical protein